MFCSKCGTELPEASQFCLKCGATLAGTSTKKARKSAFGQLMGWLALLSIIFLAYFGWRVISRPRSNFPATSKVASQPAPQPHVETITNTAFTVKAGTYSFFKFNVPPNTSNVILTGHFTATGGSGNDIIGIVMNEDSFVNWQNGHPIKTFYYSAKVTQESIRAVLPSLPDTYYLIFDNRFSLLSPKAVQASVTLSYLQ